MTDYELIDLFIQVTNGLQTTVMNFVAVLFAFLIAGYLVADKLESKIVSIVVTMFTLITAWQVLHVVGFGNDAAGLVRQLAQRAAQDPSSLGWHGAAMPIIDVAMPFVQFSPIIVLILSYIGALIFFFHQRHVSRAQ